MFATTPGLVRNSGQIPRQAAPIRVPTAHPSGFGAVQRPIRSAPMGQNPMYGQRAALSLGMEKQRALANILRQAGSVQPAPSIGINRPQGLPQVR